MPAVYEPIKMLQRMPLGEVLRMSLMGAHERIGAATAMRLGLVSEVVPASELVAAATRVADAIASQPPAAVQSTLRAIWAANDLGRQAALSIAPSILANGMLPEALVEGQQVFTSGTRAKPVVR
jgi:enoyl-CoA hydratase/carnithine racemase